MRPKTSHDVSGLSSMKRHWSQHSLLCSRVYTRLITLGVRCHRSLPVSLSLLTTAWRSKLSKPHCWTWVKKTANTLSLTSSKSKFKPMTSWRLPRTRSPWKPWQMRTSTTLINYPKLKISSSIPPSRCCSKTQLFAGWKTPFSLMTLKSMKNTRAISGRHSSGRLYSKKRASSNR